MRRTKRSTAGNRYNAVILEEQTRAELGATLSEELQEELGVFAVVEDPDDKEFKVSKTGKEIIDENSQSRPWPDTARHFCDKIFTASS